MSGAERREDSRVVHVLIATIVLALAVALALWVRPRPGHAPPSASASASSSSSTPPPPRSMRGSLGQQRYALQRIDAVEGGDGVGAIEGRVVSSTSLEGLDGATVTVSIADEEVAVTTEPDGAFRVEPASEGPVAFATVSKRGYRERSFDESPVVIVARKGVAFRGVEIALDPEVRYGGTVLTPAGDPVAGATITILAPEASTGAMTSDAEGHFDFIAPDDAILEASHEGWAPGRARVDLAVQVSRQLTITLRETSERIEKTRVTGEVRGPDGKGVGGAIVVGQRTTKRAGDTSIDLSPQRRAVTDAGGRFELGDVDPGSYELVASKAGLARAVARDVTAPSDGVILTLTKGGGIEGTVTAARTGEPIGAFTVVLRSQVGPLTTEIAAAEPFFDSEGRYALDDIPAGAYEVSALARGFAPAQDVPVLVEPSGPRARADLELGEGGIVTGHVTSGEGGDALAGARITLEGRSVDAEEALPFVVSATTDDAGDFALLGVDPSRPATLFVAAADHHARIVANVAVPSSVTVALTKLAKGERPKIELFGIGAVLKAAGDVLVIQAVAPGGGAEVAGLVPGEAIVTIGGVPAVDLGFQGAIDRIRGPEGTTVELLIRDLSGNERIVMVRRLRIRA